MADVDAVITEVDPAVVGRAADAMEISAAGLAFREGDGRDLPLPPAAFDAVVVHRPPGVHHRPLDRPPAPGARRGGRLRRRPHAQPRRRAPSSGTSPTRA
jgi:hypothetical protein